MTSARRHVFGWLSAFVLGNFASMPDKTLSEVPRDLRELYQKGTTALQRQNFDYAILTQVLQREPAFFECRQALRAAQIKKAGSGTGFFKKVLGGASSSPLIAKAQMSLRKSPAEAMQLAEQVLTSDPGNSAAHKLLAEAALEADLPRTASFEYEILLKNSPRDYELGMAYGEALARSGQIDKAEAHYTELIRLYPQKGDIAQALKDLAARKTLDEGGYDALADGKGSYRDILRDKNEAVALEQEARAVKTEDVASRLIREYEERLVQEPKNLKLLRNISELYAQQKDYERALEYAERIRQSEGGADPSLDRLIADITLKRFEHKISQLNASDAAQAQEIARLQAERDAFQLAECKARVERYPTDLAIRFELGELYLKGGHISEAIAEFQKAKSNPNKRIQAMSYLGQCFARRNMLDLAARTYQGALEEKQLFDDEKKELIYQLGCVFEKMGKAEEGIEQFKQIYEVDIGYKDVAAKVDAYYASKGA
jgi:tetratricopeptide (TPR) repeat protein